MAIGVYLIGDFDYAHPDSSYLRARYARNLINGDGFVYNPGERILLTSAPLMVLVQAAFSLPEGEVTHPPELLTLIMMGVAIAAMIRVLIYEKVDLRIAVIAAGVMLLPMWRTFGGVELWLLALTLVTLDFLQHEKTTFAAISAGLMLLVAPLAVFYVILAGLHQKRLFWLIVWIPAIVWWGFALWYFDDLRGLTLSTAPGNGFLGAVRLLILIPAAILIFRMHQLSRLMVMAVIWSLLYSLFALIFRLTDDSTLLTAALVMMAAVVFQREENMILRPVYAILVAAIAIFGFVSILDYESTQIDLREFSGSVGYIGSNREAFPFEGAVYHLQGERDPHLRDLIETGDSIGVILAAAPDFVLLENLPNNPAIDLLGYVDRGGYFERSTKIYPWQESQPANIHFGPDMRLNQVTLDRRSVLPGQIVRLRLDMEFLREARRPDSFFLFQFNVLDFQQASVGSVQQEFTTQKWKMQFPTTYHVIPINENTPPGRYDINLVIGYGGGILTRQNIAFVKVPAPTDISFDSPPLAIFDDGTQKAELMQAEIEATENIITIRLWWRSGSRFDTDYSVFVHLTSPDDVIPLIQADSPPMNGRYSTSIWDAGEVIEDVHTMDMTGISPGNYVIRVGFFNPERGRMPVPADNRDSVIVGEITVD